MVIGYILGWIPLMIIVGLSPDSKRSRNDKNVSFSLSNKLFFPLVLGQQILE